MQIVRKLCLGVAAVSVLQLVVGLVLGNTSIWQPAAVATSVGLAIGLGALPGFKVYQFTAWIVAAVTIALLFPGVFTPLNPDNRALPRNKWIMLFVIQLVMFGMGTQMSLRDFAGLGRMSWGVVVGLVLQFSVMPIVGFTLAKIFGFPSEIAAGMVLIGACSSGLASNVMTYLAKGNLVLSVALTSAGTLLAPIMTPLWMKLLAGALVEVDFVKMMLEIIKIVIVPISAALLHDYLKYASPRGRAVAYGITAIAALWLIALAAGGRSYLETRLETGALVAVTMSAFLAGSVIAGVLFHQLWKHYPQIEAVMPRFSMMGIVFFTAITTAAGRNELLAIGWLLLAAVILHNLIGYLLGYWLSRACGLDANSARTIALEVGIHNGGMATGLASAMGKIGTLGLAAAVFSPWMNVSGSILANYWRKRPTEGDSAAVTSDAEP